MDQARWLIVFSVLVCMSLTLGVLKYFYGTMPAEPSAAGLSQEPVTTFRPSIVVETRATEPSQLKEIRFPEPPAHIFSAVSHAENERESEAFAREGKILP